MTLEFKKQINDSVHGYIGITEQELRIIDNPIFQRLRYIKQLGAADMVYPGATHTRFSHSLGTMFLVDLYTKTVIKDGQIDDEQLQKLRLAALLHDIGHYPLSHTAEPLIVRVAKGKDHVENGISIVNKYFADSLESYRPAEITSLMSGKGSDKFSMLISSALDADKSDYMLRDSYYSGVSYGNIDVFSLLRIMHFDDRRIIIDKYEPPIENFLIGRYHLYRVLYHHKTVVAFNILAAEIIIRFIKEGVMLHPLELFKGSDQSQLIGYTDNMLLERMHSYLKNGSDKNLRELVRQFLYRVPLEAAYMSPEPQDVPQTSREIDSIKTLETSQQAKQRLARSAGVDPDRIFPVSLRTLGFVDELSDIFVRKKGELVPLSESNSLLLRMIGKSALHDARIYTKKGSGTRVREAFLRSLKR